MSIKESILSSTKSGRDSIIKQWCDEYIDPRHFSGVPYIITPDGKITESYKGNGIALRKDIKEVPSCVKFGDLGKGNFFSDTALTELKNEINR